MKNRILRATVLAVSGAALIAFSVGTTATEFKPFKKLRHDIKEVVAAVESLMQQVFSLRQRVDALQAANGPVAVNVDCGAGQSLATALRTAGRPLTVTVSGTCNENVVVNRDDVVLVAGAGGAIVAPDPNANALNIIADRVTVDGLSVSGGTSGIVATGATRFLMRNCTVGPTSRTGIVVFQGSQGSIESCTVQNNSSDGIAVVAAVATILGSTVTNNGRTGIIISTGGKANIGMMNAGGGMGNTITNNGSTGVYVTIGSAAFVTANNINRNGVRGSQAVLGVAGVTAVNSTIDLGFGNSITGNFGSGVQASGSTLIIGDATLGTDPNLISGNGVAAVFAGVSASASTIGISNTTIEGNAGGVFLSTRSNVLLSSGAVRNNRSDGIRLDTGSSAQVSAIVTGNAGIGINCRGSEASISVSALVPNAVSGNLAGDIGAECTGF
jgi:hypothetical protein